MSDLVITKPTVMNPDDARTAFPETTGLIEWAERFKRQPQRFTEGDRVAFAATVATGPQGRLRLKTCGTGYGTDVFEPEDLTPEDQAQLERLIGIPLMVVVTIRRCLQQRLSHDDSRYVIAPQLLIALPLVNPTSEQVEHLPVGATVLVEGTIERHWRGEISRADRYNSERIMTEVRSHLDIRTDDGQIITVPTSWRDDAPPVYNDGVLENLYRKEPLLGERVRLTVSIVQDQPSWKVSLRADTNPKMYLLTPDPSRQTAYDQLRANVVDQLAQLDRAIGDGRYDDARAAFARVRQLELTRHEHEQAQHLMNEVPEAERSVYYDTYSAHRVRQGYGIDVEAMNATQFLSFARQALLGTMPADRDLKPDVAYVTGYLQDKLFDPAIVLAFYGEAVRERMHRLEACTDDFDSYSVEERTLETYLRELAQMDHPEAPVHLAWTVEHCLENGYYRRQGEKGRNSACPRRLNDVLYQAVQALHRFVCAYPARSRFVGSPNRVNNWRTTLKENNAEKDGFSDEMQFLYVATAAAAG